MAVLTREQFMEKLNTLTDGKTDDDTLTMIQDFSDTFKSLEEKEDVEAVEEEEKEDVEAVRGEYEEKLKTLDDTWRNKYRDAFFNGAEEKKDEEEVEEEEKEEPHTYEELFKEEGE